MKWILWAIPAVLLLTYCKKDNKTVPAPVDTIPVVVDSFETVLSRVYYYASRYDTLGFPYIDSIYYKPGPKVDFVRIRFRSALTTTFKFEYNDHGELAQLSNDNQELIRGNMTYKLHYDPRSWLGPKGKLDSITVERFIGGNNVLIPKRIYFKYDADGYVNYFDNIYTGNFASTGDTTSFGYYHRSAAGLDSIFICDPRSGKPGVPGRIFQMYYNGNNVLNKPVIAKDYLFMLASRFSDDLILSYNPFLDQYMFPELDMFKSGTFSQRYDYDPRYTAVHKPFSCTPTFDGDGRLVRLMVTMDLPASFTAALALIKFEYHKVNKFTGKYVKK